MKVEKTTTKQALLDNGSKFLFYGLLAYTVIFYSQIAGRFSALAPFRIEFVVGTILILCIITKFIKGDLKFNENVINKASLFFISIAFITIHFAFVKSNALDTFILLLKFFSIYLMLIAGITNEKRLKVFTYIYLACIALLFVEPFFLSLQGKGFRYNNFMMRLYGVTGYFEHPNQLGAITAANLPLFYFILKYQKSAFKKLLFVALLLMALRVIMLTQSRTAFIGLVAFIASLWFYSNNKIKTSIIILLSCTLIWFAAPQESKDRFLTLRGSLDVVTTGEKEATSMTSRWILTKRSWTVFLENPILGVGIGCFPSVNGRRWGHWFPTHNLYTQLLSEMGIIGSIAFLILIITIFKNINRSINFMLKAKMENTFIYHLNYGLKYYLILRLVVGLFGHDLYRNWWWFAAGLSFVIFRVLKHDYNLSSNTKTYSPNQINMPSGILP